jgi:hypothetical protein
MPFGLAFAFLTWTVFELGQKIKLVNQWKSWLQPAFYSAAYAVMIVLVFYVRPWMAGNLPSNNLDMVDIYSNYIRVAEKMNEMDVDAPIIIGGADATVNAIIPSLTLKFSPLVFRVQGGGAQTKVWKSLIGEGISPEDRLMKLRESNVEYLLYRGEPAWLPVFKDEYPDVVTLVYKDQRLILYKITP